MEVCKDSLEDYIKRSYPEGDALWERYLEEIEAQGGDLEKLKQYRPKMWFAFAFNLDKAMESDIPGNVGEKFTLITPLSNKEYWEDVHDCWLNALVYIQEDTLLFLCSDDMNDPTKGH